jgi:hypothetical protein
MELVTEALMLYLPGVLVYVVGMLGILAERNSIFIQKRQPELIVLNCVFGVVYLSMLLSQVAIENGSLLPQWACPVQLVVTYVSIPVMSMTQLVRMISLHHEYKTQTEYLSTLVSTTAAGKHASGTRSSRWEPCTNAIMNRLTVWILRFQKRFIRPGTGKRQDERSKIMNQSTLFLVVLVGLAGLFVTLLTTLVECFAMNRELADVGCMDAFAPELSLLVLFICVYMVFSTLFLLSTRTMNDYVYLRAEVMGVYVSSVCGYTFYVFAAIRPALPKQDLDPHISSLFGIISIYASYVFFSVYFPLFLNYYTRFSTRNMDAGKQLEIERVLEDRVLCTQLKHIAAKQLCIENVQFLVEYREAVRMNTSQEAVVIFETYVDPESVMALNLDGTLVQRLRETYRNGELTLEALKPVYSAVIRMTQNSIIPLFAKEIKNRR